MRRLLTATVALTALLAGCASTEPAPREDAAARQPSAQQDATASGGALAELGLAGKDAVAVIDALDRLPVEDRPTDLMASVRPDEVLLTDGAGTETALEVPDDRFYVSVAPYVSSTHECFHHSLTTCTGELGDEEVRVTVTEDSGEVLVDEEATTFDNGFLGLWLPRDVTGTIEIEYDGKSGRVDFATGDEDPTCVTTLQLA